MRMSFLAASPLKAASCSAVLALATVCACDGDAPVAMEAEAPPQPQASCRIVAQNVEIRCPYHAIDGDRHTITYTDLTDGAVRMADALATNNQSKILNDPLQPLGWATQVTVVSPGLNRALTAKQRVNCASQIDCLTSMWYVYHDERNAGPDDDEWVHINLSSLGLASPYEAHGWSTWLNNDLALFNALAAPNGTGWITEQEENTPQIYALRISGSPRVELFAPDKLENQNCLTGRVNAQPPRQADQCFDGQRLSIVRRCYDEPVTSAAYSRHNTRLVNDASSGACIPGPQQNVPVLRTFVVELNAFCEPKQHFADLTPAHEPATSPEHRAMGATPEWGEMLSAISDDGRFLALGVNRVDPDLVMNEECAGFQHNLTDTNNELSGNATRHTHVCELNDQLTCAGAPVAIPTEFAPIEDLAVPGFLPGTGAGDYSVLLNRVFAPIGGDRLSDIVRADSIAGNTDVAPLPLGPATGAMIIHRPTDP